MTSETQTVDESVDTDTDEQTGEQQERTTDKNWIQKFYDNPWILLVLGLLIPFLSYTVWGWIDMLAVAPAELP